MATANGNCMSATRQRPMRQRPPLDVVDRDVTDNHTAHISGIPCVDHPPELGLKRTERRGPGAGEGALGHLLSMETSKIGSQLTNQVPIRGSRVQMITKLSGRLEFQSGGHEPTQTPLGSTGCE